MADLAEQIEARRRARETVLLRMYELCDGRVAPIGRTDVAELVTDDLSEATVEDAADWLEKAGLLEWVALGGLAGLTIHGLEEAEKIIVPTDDPLEALTVIEQKRVEAFATDLDQALQAGLITGDDDTLQEIRDLLVDLQAQIGRRPRKSVTKAIVGVLGGLLESVLGDLGADAVRAHGAMAVKEILKRVPGLFA